jgi:hypothetical protein
MLMMCASTQSTVGQPEPMWMRCQLRHVAVGLYYDVQGVEVLVGVECCLRPCVDAASACHAAAQYKRLDIRMLMLSTKT